MTPLLLPLLAAAASLVPAAVAQQASSFPVDAATALQYDCGPLCHTILQATTQADLALTGTTFDSEFYDVASNFSTAKPGDLLKLKPVDPTNLTVISGVSVYRIQYVSEDLDGTPLPVSGFVALPNSLPSSGAFPLVAFAHGTFGLYPGCAVSNGPDLFDYRSWSLLSERGYAVVATDYAGLGTNGTSHKYCAFPAHANDIFHSVTAARQAFGAVLAKPWMAVGHSQGGGAVWKLAENIIDLSRKHATDEAAHYLGTVALAPATKVWDLAKFAVQTLPSQPNIHKYSVTSLLPFLQIAIHRVYPNYGTSILSETMIKRVGLANKAQLCASGLLGLTADLDFNNLTTLTTTGATPEDIRIAEEFQNRTAPANGALAHGPIIVVQGVNDTAILAEITEKAWESACAAGNEVKLMLYPKQDHSGVLTAAAPDWLAWMEARFRGAHGRGTVCPDAVAPKCSKVTKQPFDLKYVKAEPEIDLDSFTFN